MNIFVDESGSFVPAPNPESWCVVAAVVASETARRHIDVALTRLRTEKVSREVKLHELSDQEYGDFLSAILASGSVLFAVATDSFLNRPTLIQEHRARQVASIRANVHRMKHEGGRSAIAALADRLDSLSDQLYVQLVCQVRLFHLVIARSISYFAQRQPATLREIRWRIDQKNSAKPVFERTFEQVAPALLQTHSFEEPLIMVRGFDYSHMGQYKFLEGEFPSYLQDDYGLPPVEGINLQKLLRKNLRFENSKDNPGVQVADLLASGLRRCLRGKYRSDSNVQRSLARLTLQNERGKHPVELISFADSVPAGHSATLFLKAMHAESRRYLLPRSGK